MILMRPCVSLPPPPALVSLQGRVAHPGLTSGNCSGSVPPPNPGGAYNVTYFSTQDAATAAAIGAQFDLVIMVVATDSSEGSGEGLEYRGNF